jgi:FkbM family methyltransferase
MKHNFLDFNKILKIFNEIPEIHINKTEIYNLFQNFYLVYLKKKFTNRIKIFNFLIVLKYLKFGKTDIFNLLGSDELIIFNFYKNNKESFKNALDIGANIGLHSIILSKLGYKVESYEPDPHHFKILNKNFKLNKIKNKIHNLAVSDKKSIENFTRVIDNTTGSHLSGLKNNVYGKTKVFKVQTVALNDIINKFDLIKIDCEGSEKKIFQSINLKKIRNKCLIVEVTDPESRFIIWKKLNNSKFKIYSQKKGWGRCSSINDLPKNYTEGSLIICQKKIIF